jgi:hypothetical protein
MMKIAMGSVVKDVVTGFEGIISAYTFHLTGCDVVAIKKRELDKDGKVPEPLWVDIHRVEVLGPPPAEIAKIIEGQTPHGEKAEKTGGPQDIPQTADV